MKRGEPWVLGSIVMAALALRLALVAVTPPFQAPDERAHFRYVELVADTGRLPVQPPLDIGEALRFWPQYYQPPLTYLLFAPLRVLAVRLDASESTSLRALRIGNALLGAATVAVGYGVVACLTAAGDPRRALVASVLAFLPGFAANASAFNNDALTALLAAALWHPLVAGPGRRRAPWSAGAILGAACLSKLTALVLAPLLLIVPLLQRREDAVRRAAIGVGVTVLLLAPWMIRNVMVYGDPLAVGAGSASFRWLATVLPPEMVEGAARPRPGRAFSTFFGGFGIFHNLSWVAIPGVLTPLFAVGALGWLRRGRRPGGDAFERAAGGFVAAALLALAGLLYFSFTYYGAWQGRYLYTAILPISALLAAGWARLAPRHRQAAAAAALAVLLLLLNAAAIVKLHEFYSTVNESRWGLAARL